MNLSGKQVIGFDFTASGEDTFYAVNPADMAQMEPAFYEAAAVEVDLAFQAAHKAFPLYRNVTNAERAAFLEKIGDEILSLGDELLDRCMQETGLPLARLTGERGRTVNQLKLFASVVRDGSWVDARIDTAMPDRQPAPKPDMRRMVIPIGPVAIFGASNFPLAFSVAGGDTASALAAGCPVVVKAHPAHPGTCEWVARAIVKAAKATGMPEGVFSMLHGRTHDVGLSMVNHPYTKAVGFTGSFRGGKALFDAAAARDEPIPVYAEMGSVNPVFLLPDLMKESGKEFARGLLASVTMGVGQFCTNPGLVFIVQREPGIAGEFIRYTEDIFRNAGGGTMLTRGIKENFESGIDELCGIPGVTLQSAGKRGSGACAGTPHFLSSSDAVFLEHPRLGEEVFGPGTLLVAAGDKDRLLELAGVIRGQLTASVHGTPSDLDEYRELIQLLETKAGRLIINGFPTGVEVCPSMQHGGPFPATTDSRTTSVGTAAIVRFARPVCYQGFPSDLLPDALKDGNPLGIRRMVNGVYNR